MNGNHVLQDDLPILKDAILSYPKYPAIAHLNLNGLKNKINPKIRLTLGFLYKIFLILLRFKRNKTRQKFPNSTISYSWVRNKS